MNKLTSFATRFTNLGYLHLLVILILLAKSTTAQTISVNESTAKIAEGVHPVFITTVYEYASDDVLKEWKSYMKDFKSTKISGKEEVYADNILIPSITDNTIDIYALTEKINDKESKLVVAIDMGGAYLSSAFTNKVAYEAALKLIGDFSRKLTKSAVQQQLKEAQKVLDNLTSQHKELEDKNNDLNKDIENYKSKIKKAEEEIESTTKEIGRKKGEIESQQKITDEIAIKEKKIN
ncbi:MAG: hypothetical protein IPP56_14240 [Bacteroidetes bacterium]|nr:hypothetical protein [Bacteroidota bacterium]MBP6412795.1 hypothetical protein [Bacteroidia bacterium]